MPNTECCNDTNHSSQTRDEYVTGKMRQHTRFYKKIYQLLYTLNDFLLGLWFLIGSIFFYFEPLKTWGVTLFVIASLQFVLKPTIRLIHEIDAKRYYGRKYDEEIRNT
ncbi:YrhK family protein [Virgibacillus halodenitrificans]|uniref:YrhK family protein n=1 Tax=Virgibacillus halodenitrificans TaxID=1482 RepID=UPI000760E00A|nr:YrhK family protein [Virgibacillus halodenitrificans]MCG1029076.1 YrhK family protein [Virgibacillus halodenitrificans]